MRAICRWHKDPSVPGGRFLVPGCWNRAINGDDAICHCPKPSKALPKEARALLKAIADLQLNRDQMDEALDYLSRSALNTGGE